MAVIKPLSRKQKLFLQRLLASHVLTSAEATELYNSILNMEDDNFSQEEEEDDEAEGDNMGRSVEECFGLINASLVPAFRLEIRTVTLPSSMGGNNGDDNNEAGVFQKYHAIVNLQSDSPAQNHAASTLGPHDIAFLRLAMEQIVEDDLEREQQQLEMQQQQQQQSQNEEENEGDDGDRRSSVGSTSSRRSSKRKKRSKATALYQAPAGCTGALTRVDLLNMRTKLGGPHKDKLNIAQTERVIDRMIEEGWLVLGYAPSELSNNNDNNDDEDDENFENNGSERKKRKGRKSSPRKSSRDRSSRTGTRNHYWIGPRTYMECPDLLTDLGISKERMPQFIMHHA
eukprot:CAMPEP_0185741490 /NCGR_PEP_ID=MMETSP1171-20130828/38987_1 /TAXON_ID=374046 /ORGANISM="Helicotheca tamensis, Strain CCMP826" /LENGTH=341 /DNA_ID=CAMNT_0028413467 /DNA_START=1953 /DNA_END=2978 /DNA_ORIENTATION=-